MKCFERVCYLLLICLLSGLQFFSNRKDEPQVENQSRRAGSPILISGVDSDVGTKSPSGLKSSPEINKEKETVERTTIRIPKKVVENFAGFSTAVPFDPVALVPHMGFISLLDLEEEEAEKLTKLISAEVASLKAIEVAKVKIIEEENGQSYSIPSLKDEVQLFKARLQEGFIDILGADLGKFMGSYLDPAMLSMGDGEINISFVEDSDGNHELQYRSRSGRVLSSERWDENEEKVLKHRYGHIVQFSEAKETNQKPN